MRKEDFAEVLSDINENYIQEAETIKRSIKPVWIKWSAMAACFCLFIAIMTVAPILFHGTTPNPPDNSYFPIQTTPKQSDGSDQPEGVYIPWTANFNSVTGVMDAARRYIPGYFTENLSEEELAVLQPGKKIAGLQCSGYAGFDGNGTLIDICLTISTTIPGTNINVLISESGITRDYIMDMAEPVISTCGKIEYKVYQWDSGNNRISFSADAVINGYRFAFTLEASKQNEEQAKADISRILECFACYPDGKPDLSVIVADEIPEWFDKALSLQEALNDSAYGAFMLSETPDGFSAESIRRYKDQTADYLSGLWTKGCNELHWTVYTLNEADEDRLTNVTDKENYDLSLYPIPRADSVPNELREIVDNPIFKAEELTLEAVYCRAYKVNDAGDTDSWRMRFSVKYGNVIVSVSTKGIEPEWLYQQLMILNMR